MSAPCCWLLPSILDRSAGPFTRRHLVVVASGPHRSGACSPGRVSRPAGSRLLSCSDSVARVERGGRGLHGVEGVIEEGALAQGDVLVGAEFPVAAQPFLYSGHLAQSQDDRMVAGRCAIGVGVGVDYSPGRDVPAGVPGEAVYRSPQLCTGYWNNATATADAFDGGWFHSGDLVTQDPQGYLTVVDRIKDVINTGGVLVSSREVEDAVYHHESVAEVAVVGLPDPKWIEAVTAFVVLEPAAEVSETQLLDHTRQQLAPYKVPKRIVFIEELPRNQSGKFLKRELRRRT
ncbi:AMP-binding protein [Nocardia terpenica]|uniref:AMP-binding protein n=1 Tax=Nocardia terpenica TaxID=455432 RepID=A0A6G9Z9B7_9NOCA|nr:AMP-binding protein [Nocardia terpenica]